ncbi:MAG TPA: response regulator [Candidatus Nitrosotalea sp.]|nr:response regulator [Candidatus Nitrosotalea sp.]
MSVKRILVVDDDPSMRFLLRLIFERSGHEVSEAQHGVAALIRIKDELPDLIVTDMMMPVMDGGELITHLRSNPRTADVPILALTANPDAREAAGDADYVLGKPFDQSMLLATVNSILVQPRSIAG